MTHDAAVAHVRDTLKGQEITSSINGRPVPSFAVISREALATLIDCDWTVRPLGVVESEGKRERADTSGTVENASATENGTSASSGLATAVRSPVSAPAPSHACRECGAKLTPHEIGRAKRMPSDTKYHGLCRDCTMLKAGLV